MTSEDAGKKDSPSSSARWWEFYLVRYAAGTAVGAMICCYLVLNTGELRSFLPSSDKLGASHLILLTAIGFTYCYISSAPILVIHATRALFEAVQSFSLKRFAESAAISATFSGTIIAISAIYPSSNSDWSFLSAITLGLFLATTLLQLGIVIYALLKSQDIHDFYVKLSKKRISASPDFIDSYRHLREHGNSFLVILFELLLGAILYVACNRSSGFSHLLSSSDTKINAILIVLLAWILPATFVWLLAIAIERHFTDDFASVSSDSRFKSAKPHGHSGKS